MNSFSLHISRVSRHRFKPPIPQILLYQRVIRSTSTRAQPAQTYKMAAPSTQLADKLKSLSLTEPLPKYPNCYPELNTVDIYRAHISSVLTEITGVDAKIIYPALQWTQTLEKGDLVLPVPALRVKGKKPNELAAEWCEKVIMVPQKKQWYSC